MSDNDEITVLLVTLGVAGGIWALVKIIKGFTGPERCYRVKQDAFGLQKGQVITEGELVKVLHAECEARQTAENEGTEEDSGFKQSEVDAKAAQEQWYRENGYEKCDCGAWSRHVATCHAPGCYAKYCDHCGAYSGGYCCSNCQSYDD